MADVFGSLTETLVAGLDHFAHQLTQRALDAALVALSVALITLGVLVMTGVFNPNTLGDRADAEAIQRSLEANSFSSAPGLVWRRSLGQEPN